MRYSIDRDYCNESSWLPLSQNLTVHFSPTLFFTELLLYFFGIWLAESFPYKFHKFNRHDWNDEFSLCVVVRLCVCLCVMYKRRLLVRVLSNLVVHLSANKQVRVHHNLWIIFTICHFDFVLIYQLYRYCLWFRISLLLRIV